MDCNGCTLCCKLIHVPWKNSPAGEYCLECIEGVGCRIYGTAPDMCLAFKCSYNLMEKVGIEMRPDMCGVIFERISEYLFIALSDKVPLKRIVRQQIDKLVDQGFSVAFGRVGFAPVIFVGKGRGKEDSTKILKEKYNDSSKLYSRFS